MSNDPDTSLTGRDDEAQRFLFEDADIRGHGVSLDAAHREILAIHQYAPGVSRLLGEFLAASVLLSSNLKFEGRLTLQVRSQGQVPLLMVECDQNLRVRGIAHGAEEATASDNALLLSEGQLAITIDPEKGQRYQGIVPLSGHSLASSLDAYFEQSEQLQTRIWLAANGERAGGLLLQQLPQQITPDAGQREEQWHQACALAATITDEELLELNSQALLYRLFHELEVRLFSPEAVNFHCSCSRERTYAALTTLNPAELEEILLEDGHITMDCEFCQQQYLFKREDLAEILGAGEAKILH